EEIMEEAEKWDAICIFAHVTSDKGFFKISSGNSKTRIYKHRLTQIFQKSLNTLLNNGCKNIIVGGDPQYCDNKGKSKSICCITASDAKSLTDIGKNNLWIKADPTFEGLKQIIYEPVERVYIGEEPPYKIERNKIIKSITVSNSNRWFEDNKPIPLNEGLVSIIGGKGTGKTAILDLIAYVTKSYKCYEKDEKKSKSFLKKAFRELKGSKIKIEWDNGNSDEKEIGSILEEFAKEGKVRYLPQDYVDQLCTEIGKSELEEQIENVIFQKIPSENKATFTDFKNYKKTQLKTISDKKYRIIGQIEDTNFRIYEYEKIIESKASKNEEIWKISKEIGKLNQEMKKISDALGASSNQKKVLEELNLSIEKKSELEKIISELKTKILKIEEIKNEISVFIENSNTFAKKLKTDLYVIGIKEEYIKKTKVVLEPENLDQILDTRKKEIDDEIKKQKIKLDNLDKKIKDLNSKIKLEKSKQDKINEINKSLSDLKKKKDALVDSDVKKIEDAEKELPQLLNNRESFFINYFKLIFEEKEKLKEIYSPLENILKESGEEDERLFDFTVKFSFDVKSMADEGHKLIDLRADGRYRQSKPELLREELEKLRFELNLNDTQISESDKNSIKEFLRKIKEFFTEGGITIVSQLKEKRYAEKDFDNWIYHTKYYNINYSIKFNGIELDNLSPGLKGVALLILFLELDKEDRRPILIDQPEENLDNRSVYITLMRYFKDAKKRRQVIIVTHNPNLVVNTDSEQVIVADFDRGLKKQNSRIFYVSGSLENTFKDNSASIVLEEQGIREHVCLILEGGRDAFEKREKKYGFKTT
ncbi:MAG TPA: AAA family ATPase, partial [Candidatus Paceibacterota bacterium]|nr:AAA family ATPase [Candidatus Paceibacterota bacterium]